MPTGIPFCDEVWNVCVGCTKIKSGCQNCWAERLHNQRHTAWLGGWTDCPKQYHKAFGRVQLLTDRLTIPLHWRNPRTIFVNSMGDTFHKDVPFAFIDDIMSVIYQRPDHKWLFFTKRWARALEYYKSANTATQHVMRDSVHLYFSASTQTEVDEAVPILLQIPVAVLGLSMEPLLGFVLVPRIQELNSIITGCESGPKRRLCDIEDIKSVADQCKAAGVPCYVKQIPIAGKCVTLKKKTESIWPSWAKREMPK